MRFSNANTSKQSLILETLKFTYFKGNEVDKTTSKPTTQQEKAIKGSSLKDYPKKNFEDTKEKEFKKLNVSIRISNLYQFQKVYK